MLKKKNKWAPRALGLALVGAMGLQLSAASRVIEKDAFRPVLRVGKIQAPVIDGKIGEEEWKHASAFTGVTAEGVVGGHGSLVPDIQQVQWYAGYDDKYLYLSMRSTHPEGTYPVARSKLNDDASGKPEVLFEDHVEVQLLALKREEATEHGKGFYKIMANPKATYVDQWLYNGTIGTEEQWSMGGPIKCHVTKNSWELEMAIEIERMDIKSLEGRSLVAQLVRTDSCVGMYFAGWVGTHWLDFNKFGSLDFSQDTPAFRFLKLGEIGAGELDAKFELVGGVKDADVQLDVVVSNVNGKEIHRSSEQISLKSGETKNVQFQKSNLPISVVEMGKKEDRNMLEVKATAKVGGKTVTLYHNKSPFMQFDEDFKTKFLDKWVAGRPQSGEWEFKTAYHPYESILETSVDLDFFGIPENITKAKSYLAEVKAADGVQVLGSLTGSIKDLAGESLVMELPELKEGDYSVEITLLDAKGQRIDRKTQTFKRKVFDWERNKLGTQNEVIRPFEPIQIKRGKVNMWGKSLDVKSGLPHQIVLSPPTGTFGQKAKLLAAPVHFEVTKNGKTEVLKTSSSSMDKAEMHRVDFTGTQASESLQAQVKSMVEYDGWFEVEASLKGQGQAEAIDLVIDFDDRKNFPIDTLYVQRLGDGKRGNRFSEIPKAQGVHFESTELLAYKNSSVDWKSFVPRTFVGNGDRGLWFFAWSANDWQMQDEQPVVRVERLKNGDVRLRVRIVAGETDLSQERNIKFALQPTPAKANHPRYRTYEEEGGYMHDTRGFRRYGSSVDGFVNKNDEDYEELRKFILYGMRGQSEAAFKAKKPYTWWSKEYQKTVGHGGKVIMYGSGQLMGFGEEEFDIFGGSWLGNSHWKPNRYAATDEGRFNYQGTHQWKTDKEMSVANVNWSQSMIDFFVWYHKPLMEKSGFNGTWWDNTSMGTVRQYNRQSKKMEEIWYLYPRRQLVKRLNVLGWSLMRPPAWMSNMHVDLGWAQYFWMVENDWEVASDDMVDEFGLGEFRAMARTKSTMQVTRCWIRQERNNMHKFRSLRGMLLSHDIHRSISSHHRFQKRSIIKGQGDIYLNARQAENRMRGLVNLGDTSRCLFAGYWRTEDMVQPSVANVQASVYTNSSLKTAAIVLLNSNKKDVYLAGTSIDINKLIPVEGESLLARRIFDVETGETIQTHFENGKYVISEPLKVVNHEFRLIGIEAE